jgi:nucleotide-binding universal stress UspA family protein
VPASVERRVVQSRLVAGTIAEESVGAIICLATTAEPFDRDGFRHSITEQLVAASASPVIVVGPKCRVDTPLTKVIVAIDPDHNQTGLAYWATHVGYALGIPVEFLHIADEPPRDLRSNVRHGQPAEGQSVAECLNEHASGALLAMGSHGRTGFRRLVQGSVGAAVISTSTEPVMILGPNASRPA